MSEQMLLNCSVLLACKLVSAELPVLPLSGCGGDVVGNGSGSEPPVTALLEQLAELWEKDSCFSTPLHLLFTPLTVTAVLKASDTERKNYLFLVRKLVDRGLLSKEEVIAHWKKLTDLALPAELIENFQLKSETVKPTSPLAELQSHMDILQVSHQTVEGAT